MSRVRHVELSGGAGGRWVPREPTGVGALVLAGSSGRVDAGRAELLARHGVTAESIRWFGGAGQHEGPWEIPLEVFVDRVAAIAADCDRVVVLGTSFGAEAALLTGALCAEVSAVVALAPSDVVWAGVRRDGSVTSHWTRDGVPLPFVPFDVDWHDDATPGSDGPEYVGLYRSSRRRHAAQLAAAAIAVERIDELVLVAGGDDRVWPSVEMAEAIRDRRSAHGLGTVLVTDPDAGHRAVLPGEPVVTGGMTMGRGGDEAADRRLGTAAWAAIERLLRR